MDLEAVNRTLAATVRKQEDELKAADAEIARLKEGVAVTGRLFAASRDALAEVSADNERLRAALEPFAKAAESFDGMPIKNPEEWFAYRGVNAGGEVSGAITIGDLRRVRAALTAQPAAPGGE